MLALATHEVHFTILREVVFTPGQKDNCFLCGQVGHFAANCEGKAKRKSGDFDEKGDDAVPKKPFQFLNIWTLREYLEYEFRIPNSPFKIDFECIIDDFIFICFFVGNDFLPHMPTLEIREGAINLLMAVYKKNFRSLGGYLTNGCKPNLKRVENFIQVVGSYEDTIFRKRALMSKHQAERIKRGKAHERGDDREPQLEPESLVPVAEFYDSRLASAPVPSPYENAESGKCSTSSQRPKKVACFSSTTTVGAAIVEAEDSLDLEMNENKEELKVKLKELLREKSDGFNSEKQEEDKIKLGQLGWKERYYEEKFSGKSLEELEGIRKDVVQKYTEGLCWVMHYYYEGVCSWNWYYPYHYAPFASDIKDVKHLNIKFEMGTPFKPFNQLLGVLPAASAHALPVEYRKLMTDPNSPIIDFYPEDFEVDMNGKRFSWQGIPKLPFIDEQRLLAEVAKIEITLTVDEAHRNSMKSDILFITVSHPLSPFIFSLDDRCKQLLEAERVEVKEKLDPRTSGGMNGYISLCNGSPCPFFRSPVAGMEDILNNNVLFTIYTLPDYHTHIPKPPPGVKFPKKIVSMGDIKESVLWHEDSGRNRRPMENDRGEKESHHYNCSTRPYPPGSIFGPQLGDAACKLVLKSLEMKAGHDRIGIPRLPWKRRNALGCYPGAHARTNSNEQDQKQSLCQLLLNPNNGRSGSTPKGCPPRQSKAALNSQTKRVGPEENRSSNGGATALNSQTKRVGPEEDTPKGGAALKSKPKKAPRKRADSNGGAAALNSQTKRVGPEEDALEGGVATLKSKPKKAPRIRADDSNGGAAALNSQTKRVAPEEDTPTGGAAALKSKPKKARHIKADDSSGGAAALNSQTKRVGPEEDAPEGGVAALKSKPKKAPRIRADDSNGGAAALNSQTKRVAPEEDTPTGGAAALKAKPKKARRIKADDSNGGETALNSQTKHVGPEEDKPINGGETALSSTPKCLPPKHPKSPSIKADNNGGAAALNSQMKRVGPEEDGSSNGGATALNSKKKRRKNNGGHLSSALDDQ